MTVGQQVFFQLNSGDLEAYQYPLQEVCGYRVLRCPQSYQVTAKLPDIQTFISYLSAVIVLFKCTFIEDRPVCKHPLVCADGEQRCVQMPRKSPFAQS